jgi:hypothetical protein
MATEIFYGVILASMEVESLDRFESYFLLLKKSDWRKLLF